MLEKERSNIARRNHNTYLEKSKQDYSEQQNCQIRARNSAEEEWIVEHWRGINNNSAQEWTTTRIGKGTNNRSNVVWRGMNNNARKEQKEHYEVEKEHYEVESAVWK
jgi:hypothetical protein